MSAISLLASKGKEYKSEKESKLKTTDETKATDEIAYIFGDGKEVKKSMFIEPSKLEDRECQICLRLFSSPVILDNTRRLLVSLSSTVVQKQCGHQFCLSCIEAVKTSARTRGVQFKCPVCNQDSTDAVFFPAEQLTRDIAKLDVKCEYEIKGCRWTGMFGIDGQDWRRHGDGCSFRGTPCPECKDIVLYGKESAHQVTCRRAIVACSIDLRCKEKFRREEVETHLASCRYRSKPCPMKIIGCTWIGALVDFDAHNIASDSHLPLIRQSVEEREKMKFEIKELKVKLDEKEREVKEKTKNCTKLCDEFGRTTIEVDIPDSDENLFDDVEFEFQGSKYRLVEEDIYCVKIESENPGKWKIILALEDKTGNVIGAWNMGPEERIHFSGDLYSKALTDEHTINFRVVFVHHGKKKKHLERWIFEKLY